jgi:hypothetical protein
VGHDNTVEAERKKEEVKMFFSGKMSVADAYKFLTRHAIGIVYYGPQEKEDLPAQAGGGISDLQKFYPFLMRGYTNRYVSVYHVSEK